MCLNFTLSLVLEPLASSPRLVHVQAGENRSYLEHR